MNTDLNTKITNHTYELRGISNDITDIKADIQSLATTVTNNKTATDADIMHLQEQLDNL
jgi:hypothetical protein